MDLLILVSKQKPSPTILGRNLQSRRKKAKLSQSALAAKIGVHRQTIAQLETTVGFNPTLELLQKLAGGLDCTVSELVSSVPTIPSDN